MCCDEDVAACGGVCELSRAVGGERMGKKTEKQGADIRRLHSSHSI